MDETKIILKSLLELEQEIDNGKTAHAAGINHGFISIRLIGPGRYCMDIDVLGKGAHIWVEEERSYTFQGFLDSITWEETNEFDIELQTYLLQSIWFIGDNLDPWDTRAFVWPANHIESIEVIHAASAAAKANNRTSFNALLGDISIDL